MITPQQIEQISFGRATFGGYDMQSVDELLEPLTEDYVTLYKENALLKSKMRVLVTKLEEYRKNEASMKDAIVNAQKTCDLMVREAEEKCKQMLSEAGDLAAVNSKNADALVSAEEERVEEARRVAAAKIDELTQQLNACVQALERIKSANAPVAKPAPAEEKPTVYDYDSQPDIEPAPAEETVDPADAVADEISSNLEALVGTTEDVAPKAAPQHPVTDTTTKFANLKFGSNYNPNHQ